MIKVTKKRIYDTETATQIAKVTQGIYGDPAGYELTMYQTPEGDYFLYTYGGKKSEYSKEKIFGYSKPAAKKWLEAYFY